jgi:hypothetical protein
MNYVEDPRKASRDGLPKIIKKDMTTKRRILVKKNDQFSLGLKILIGVVCLALIAYGGLATSMVNISDSAFDLSFIQRTNPRDEFSIVRPRKFNWEMVRKGASWANEHGNLLVVSLVRSCEGSIWCMEKKIAVLASIFKSVHVVFFENDSSDGTRMRLLDYSAGKIKMGGDNVKVTVVNPFTMAENEEVCRSPDAFFTNNVKAGIKGASTKRIVRMAFLRNKVLDYIYAHQSEYDTLLMTDLDIIGRMFPEGIKETVGYLKTMKNIGFVSFRGFHYKGGFFDPYSFRGTDFISRFSLGSLLMCMRSMYTMPSGAGLVPVVSAHSGGIFSNLPLPPRLRYSAEHVITIPMLTDVYLCEHVTLMEKVPNNFVNTNMTYLVKDNV